MSAHLIPQSSDPACALPAAISQVRTGRLRRLWTRYVQGQERHQRIVLGVQLLYAGLFTGWFLYSHTWPAPDIIAIALLLFAFLAARGVSFLRDWTPFLLLLLAYVALTSITAGLASHAHVQFPINADRWMFSGTLPTTALQSHFWNPAHVHWYDYVATILYPMHFVVPLVLAFGFWMWKKRLYWRFIASYLLLTYAGFVTYIVYPMAPPWLAANEGRIPPVQGILDQVHYGGASNPIVVATDYLRPNPVAAMPSLHAAFPVLVWLVLWRMAPRWGWATVLYPIGMAVSVVYLGEHYVVDVLAGWLYAVITFAITWTDFTRLKRFARPGTNRKTSGPISVRLTAVPDR